MRLFRYINRKYLLVGIIGSGVIIDNISNHYDIKPYIHNWSKTYNMQPNYVYYPHSIDELVKILAEHHQTSSKLRVMGNGLSPNGISFTDNSNNVVNMAHLDKILDIDIINKTVTVQPGISVDSLTKELSKYNLTLPNFASIQSQQIGGLIQTGAHGTGVNIPPSDDFVVKMKLLTPAKGIVNLSRESKPELFQIAKLSLGVLGIVTEVTLQCVEKHLLKETTIISKYDDIERHHKQWLKQHQHLRYLWIPYTDNVVVIKCDRIKNNTALEYDHNIDNKIALKAMFNLFNQLRPKENNLLSENVTIAEMREILLNIDPLNVEHIKKVNRAEVEYWKHAQGERIDYSDRILSFECGGRQLVSEVAFEMDDNNNDLKYIKDVLKQIENENIPAPSPIEQRWTNYSSSLLSPAYSNNHNSTFSWVGIIMYLLSSNHENQILDEFHRYKKNFVGKRMVEI